MDSLTQPEEDEEEDGGENENVKKYILKNEHPPNQLEGMRAADELKGAGKRKKGKSGALPELRLLYSRDEEVAKATGRAEACGHYEILKWDAADGEATEKMKVTHVVRTDSCQQAREKHVLRAPVLTGHYMCLRCVLRCVCGRRAMATACLWRWLVSRGTSASRRSRRTTRSVFNGRILISY